MCKQSSVRLFLALFKFLFGIRPGPLIAIYKIIVWDLCVCPDKNATFIREVEEGGWQYLGIIRMAENKVWIYYESMDLLHIAIALFRCKLIKQHV